MAPNPIALFLLLLLLLLTSLHSSTSSSYVISDLSALQSKSPHGVIHLSDNLLRRILAMPTPRPFQCLIFFDAREFHSNKDLSLPELKSEFYLVSSAFQAAHPHNKTLIFFFDIEFQESKTSFLTFGVDSLPHIRLIPATASAADIITNSIQMNSSAGSIFVESLAEFIHSKTNLTVGSIDRPPAVSNKQITISAVVLLVWVAVITKKLISGDSFLHEKSVWMGGTIFVYFFSVSGAMFNIIRKTPFYLIDQRNPEQVMFFYQGSSMQLGAEGFTVGLLYTTVGIMLAFLTHALVEIRDKKHQWLIMIGILCAMMWAVNKVFFLANWKSGYRCHPYWPNRWR